MEKLLKVDFHCHTAYSPDSLNRLPTVIKLARQRGLDRLIVTDHNRLDGAQAAFKMAPDFIIMGEEILTDRGEILAAYVKEEIPRNLHPLKVIELLRAQGAFISVSHPFDSHRGWKPEDLLEIAPLVDAVEIFNARCVEESFNDQAAAFALQHGLAGTVGSDAHIPHEIGRVGLLLPEFSNAEELKQVIKRGKVDAQLSEPWVHFFSYATYKFNKKFFPQKIR